MMFFQFTHCCPRTAGILEMRFEEWIRLAILDRFDPVNENQVP